MKTRELPHHICAHPDGLLVRVHRGALRYQAFVPKGNANALDRAIGLRDNFLKQLPTELLVVRSKPRSNTGISGISETVTWSHGRAYDCFNVSWNFNAPDGRRRMRMKRVYFKTWSEREAALQRAIALREEKTGLEVAHV